MKQYLIGLFIALIGLFFLFTNAKAQDTAGIKSEPVELGIYAIYAPCEDPSSTFCVPYPTDVPNHPDQINKDHELGLFAENLPANADIYIAGCINTIDGARCTTGNTVFDNLLNSYNSGDVMSPDPSHQFKALENPKKTDKTGLLDKVIVRSYTSQATTHFFNGYYIDNGNLEEINISPSPQTTPEVFLGGMQQGELDLVTPTPTSLPLRDFDRSNNQDPKGRFFDSQSLEPIPNGEITLLNNLKKIFVYRDLINPQKVKINGEFNFWVPNGVYYLDLNIKPTNYSWPIKIDRVHPNYTKAYYCDPDVKNDKSQVVPLYLEQYSIAEYNKLVHCDVPLDPGSNPSYHGDVKSVDFSISRSTNKLTTNYIGHVTHPLTVINLKGENTGKIAATVNANKLGSWKVTINNTNYPLNSNGTPDRLIAVYTKVDLTGQTIYAPVIGTIFEPLLTYVEGYAYNDSGQILPSAKIGYQQDGTNKIVYVTTSDNNGYFKIPTRYLPSFGYKLVFAASNQTKPIIISTSVFANKNADYLKKSNINLITKINKEIIDKNSVPTSNIKDSQSALNQNQQGEVVNTQGENKSKSQLILAVVVFLILIIISVIIIALILFQRAKTPPSNLV